MSRMQEVCQWCGKAILYDRVVRMWYWARPGKPANYYCAADKNEDRCQHVPCSRS